MLHFICDDLNELVIDLKESVYLCCWDILHIWFISVLFRNTLYNTCDVALLSDVCFVRNIWRMNHLYKTVIVQYYLLISATLERAISLYITLVRLILKGQHRSVCKYFTQKVEIQWVYNLLLYTYISQEHNFSALEHFNYNVV